MSIGLKIIIRLELRPKKDEFHPCLFSTDKVPLGVVANVDGLLSVDHEFFDGHVKQPYIRFLEPKPG